MTKQRGPVLLHRPGRRLATETISVSSTDCPAVSQRSHRDPLPTRGALKKTLRAPQGASATRPFRGLRAQHTKSRDRPKKKAACLDVAAERPFHGEKEAGASYFYQARDGGWHQQIDTGAQTFCAAKAHSSLFHATRSCALRSQPLLVTASLGLRLTRP